MTNLYSLRGLAIAHLLAVLALPPAATTGCSSGGDGDGDGDADADGDSDADTDADADADGQPCEDNSDCEEGDFCNGVWECRGEFGCYQLEEPIDCDDEITCTADSCLEPGECDHEPMHEGCDDGNECTINTCNTECTPDTCDENGCAHENVPNGDPCDDGACFDGTCCGGCWDDGVCRDDPERDMLQYCGESSLCQNCDDGNECTIDECVEGDCLWTNLGPETECEGGVCRDGECCTGCWIDGTAECVEVEETDLMHCGISGDICSECPCLGSDTCDDGVCAPVDLQVTFVALGRQTTCALTQTGRLYCWGDDGSCKLGLGDSAENPTTTPGRVDSGDISLDWTGVSIWHNHVCGVRAVDDERIAFCWGDSNSGRLGLGEDVPGDQCTPQPLEHVASWVEVAAGENNSCATTTGGALHCWGSAGQGRLGNCRTRPDVWSPEQVRGEAGDLTSGWLHVDAGHNHVCGINEIAGDRRAFCWGNGFRGRLGIGTAGDESCPRPVAGGYTNWSQISAGEEHTCGIREDEAGGRTLWCWGGNTQNQLGADVVEASRNEPIQVGTDADWEMVTAGSFHTCAIKTDGQLYCWGHGMHYRLGTGTTANQPRPTRIGDGADWIFIAAGGRHTCGIRNDNRLWCWGDNDRGQLGLGHRLDQRVPVFICLE